MENEAYAFQETSQGCVLSPDPFNLYSEMTLRGLEDMPGLKVDGKNMSYLRYAADTVLIAETTGL